MSTYFLIDIGAGTMDLLFWDDASPLHYKAVVRSPVPYLADTISSCPGDLLITGQEMGGGSVTTVLKNRAREHRIVISEKASATLHHDRDRIAAWGIEVVSEEAAQKMITAGQFNHFVTADIDAARLKKIVNGLGVPFEFDVVGICAQDHGVPPKGVSHLDYRHRLFTAILDKEPHAHALLYEKDAVPLTMNRLRSIAESAGRLPAKEIYVMDSGMAAIQGASLDSLAMDKECIAVLDVATSHTLGATLVNNEIAGFFEYHTSEINGARVDRLLKDLAGGRLSHAQILDEGGHGAYLRRTIGFENIETIIATGPRRSLLSDSTLAISYGAPMGDNMMTGTLGLLSAIRARKDLEQPKVI